MPADRPTPRASTVARTHWHYQPIWWEDSGGRTYGLCEMHFDMQDRLVSWSAEPFTWPQGADIAELSRDLVNMIVDTFRWEPVAYADLRPGMLFTRRIDEQQSEALARMVERTAHNFKAASDV